MPTVSRRFRRWRRCGRTGRRPRVQPAVADDPVRGVSAGSQRGPGAVGDLLVDLDGGHLVVAEAMAQERG
ncbi:hypothetical protein ACFRSX_37790 [Streptomyces goshikiensis]|uniref:hypothetical protein n=1 Tax=Streptomyces TaxID=1883 RepID=UPI002D793A06|nr:hypothetical protein [Streptomyces sp. CB02120-2]